MNSRIRHIKQVAEAADVSTATVSRVLSGAPHVRPSVRERVLAAAAQLGYRPNLVARSLRAQRSRTVGLIVADVRNPFFTEISRAVEDIAYAQGYSVVLCNSDEDPEKETIYLNLMQDTKVAGVIVSPTAQALERVRTLRLDIPAVLIDRASPELGIDAVVMDNVGAARLLTAHLIANGYRRIGAIFGAVGATGQERLQGYEQALSEHGITPTPELARSVPPQVEPGRAAAALLLDLTPPPDALLTGNSFIAAGALSEIQRRRLVIPQGVALVSFDETVWEELMTPPITVVAQPTYDIGKTAADLLFSRIREPQRPITRVTLEGRLLARGSSAPLTAVATQGA